MQRLTLNTIPKWLEHSALATSLREGKTSHDGDENEHKAEEDAFEVPLEYCMSDIDILHIATTKQLKHMLQTMHYWGEYERVPWPVLDAVREKRLLLDELNETKWVHEPAMATIVQVLQIIYRYDMTKQCANKLIMMGSIYGLQYAHENCCPWDVDTCMWAASYGHLDCLRYAHENGCPWDTHTCLVAAINGHLECLRYAHENGCPWDTHICLLTAKHGQLDCLRYAHENGGFWDEWTCACAAEHGQLECLRYAHENGCPWDEWTCACAAEHGQLECLRYAHENGCPWNEKTCKYAINTYSLDCLKYAIEHDCPHNADHLAFLSENTD